MSQTDMILRFIEATGSITAAEAVGRFGCYRLAARIAELRRMGYAIRSEQATAKNRYGNTVTFCRYSFEERNR